MKHVANWVMGGITAVFAVASLFVASRAGHGAEYYAALAFFAFAALFIMLLIKTGCEPD